MLAELSVLLQRDVDRLIAEVEAYPTDESLWVLPEGLANSGGNLVLHLVGNLNHYIGARLGATGYLRDRPAEFSTRGLSRAELVARLHATRNMLGQVLAAPLDLDAVYPENVLGQEMTVRFFLPHLYGHLNWHRGQVNIHRRLMTVAS